METLSAAKKANNHQKAKMGIKLEKLINTSLKDKKIAVLGLSFKANTDDVLSLIHI